MQPHTSFTRYIAALTLGALITALLLFTLPSYAAAQPYQPAPVTPANPTFPITLPGSPTPTPTAAPQLTPSPTVEQTTPTSTCPIADPTVTDPIIEFCSPLFKGNAEGPFGTHITLMGRNIPHTSGGITGLYLLQTPVNKSAPHVSINNNACIPDNGAKCLRVDSVQTQLSQIQNTQHFTLNFNWTLQQAEPDYDYYAVLTYKDTDKPRNIPIISPFGFTLLTSSAPCITVSLDPKVKQHCTNPENAHYLTTGSTVYIHGENWNSTIISQTVNIELSSCQLPCQGSRTPLTSVTITPQTNGTFTFPAPVKQDHIGDYWIVANNYVQDNVNTKGIPMLADDTLTFGHEEKGDATSLNIQIVHPCIMVTSIDPSHTIPPEQAPSNCMQSSSKPVVVTAGEKFYLQGFYWLTSQEHKVKVNITCVSICTGSKEISSTAPFTTKQGTSGYFYQTVPVPNDSIGIYTINVTQPLAATTYTSSLKIQVNKSPVTNMPFNTWPLLALLPALASLLLYILTQRRRTIPPAPATQTMPGGPGPITRRASPPPSAIRQQPGGRR